MGVLFLVLKDIVLSAESDMMIGSSAFSGCTHIVRIYATGETSLKINENEPLGSNGLDYSGITLYVPAGSLETYKTDPAWNVYGMIVEYDPAERAVYSVCGWYGHKAVPSLI